MAISVFKRTSAQFGSDFLENACHFRDVDCRPTQVVLMR